LIAAGVSLEVGGLAHPLKWQLEKSLGILLKGRVVGSKSLPKRGIED
jgi:hypothetical protein